MKKKLYAVGFVFKEPGNTGNITQIVGYSNVSYSKNVTEEELRDQVVQRQKELFSERRPDKKDWTLCLSEVYEIPSSEYDRFSAWDVIIPMAMGVVIGAIASIMFLFPLLPKIL